jgi:endonuclease/exonuclease/phosphatase family metal-dependent hydrolase
MRPRRGWPGAVVVTLLASTVWAGTAPARADGGYPGGPPGTAADATYRMASYNTQLRPATAGDAAQYNMDNETRADAIATHLRNSDFDVIALQEVFHEGARGVLVDRLGPSFPTVVEKLGAGFPNDSGLLFFSKFPIIEVTPPAGGECAVAGAAGKCRVAFHPFAEGDGADTLANKGVSFVRLANSNTGRAINVFNLHLQSNTDDDPEHVVNRETRRKQILEVRAFIEAWASQNNQDAVVLGDFNIVGPPPQGNRSIEEYTNNLAGPAGLGGIGFLDSYEHQALGVDPVLTFDGPKNVAAPGGQARLDYVFLRPANNQPMCVGHHQVRRDYTIERGSGAEYANTDTSDHYAVDVTIGPVTPQCGPQSAKLLAPDGEYAQQIAQPGVYQWFRVAEAGTYSFDISDGSGANMRKMGVVVYRPDDLSTVEPIYDGAASVIDTPASQFSNRAVYAMDGAFLVRLSGGLGDYVLRIHRHKGVDFDDAIALDPHTKLQQTQLDTSPTKGQSTVHYSLIQQRLSSGAAQQLTFETDGHPDVPLRLRVFDAQRVPIMLTPLRCEPAPPPGPVNCTPPTFLESGPRAGRQTLATGALSGERQRLFLTVDRVGCGHPSVCHDTYGVQWTTNYRRLDLREVFVEDFEAGRTRMFLRIDGAPEVQVDLGDFERSLRAVIENDPMGKRLPARVGSTDVASIGFAGSVAIRFECSRHDGASDPEPAIGAGQVPDDADDPVDLDIEFTMRGSGGNEIGTITVPIVGQSRVHN